jgi:homoserine O-acetyltransferase/O-succinyltransferase
MDLPDIEGTDITIDLPLNYGLRSGQKLFQKKITARTYGPKNGPWVVVAGGISAGRILFAKEDTTDSAPGWWDGVAGPDCALDLNKWRVLSIEFAPQIGAPEIYTISTHDQADLVAMLLDHLGVETIHAFIGASYGAMIALAFAETYPARVKRLGIISAAHRAHPMATAFRGLQRRLLMFGKQTGRDQEGVSLARQLAMTTYRSSDEFDARFDGPAPSSAGDDYNVCAYLRARGDAYRASDVNRWIALSDSLDRHRIDPSKITAHTTLAAVPNDRLVPYEDMLSLNEALRSSRMVDLISLYGHDAFLKEIDQISLIVRKLLQEPHL